jgi:hypothetical protein
MKKILISVFVIFCAIVLILVGTEALREVEGGSDTEPSGRYRAVVTFRNYESWLGRAPGDSSGKPGFITIYGQSGESYGKIPVDMIAQLSDLYWTDKGARIPAHCEWDFDRRTYSYWNASQTHETIENSR